MQLPHCPKCNSEYTYQDNNLFICPECAHEWSDSAPADDSDTLIVKDANGNLLADGDAVTVVKDLKVKGSSSMRHQSEEHPPGGRRPQHRLQDRWLWPDEAEIRIREKELIASPESPKHYAAVLAAFFLLRPLNFAADAQIDHG